jgi:hypothetical protein
MTVPTRRGLDRAPLLRDDVEVARDTISRASGWDWGNRKALPRAEFIPNAILMSFTRVQLY